MRTESKLFDSNELPGNFNKYWHIYPDLNPSIVFPMFKKLFDPKWMAGALPLLAVKSLFDTAR